MTADEPDSERKYLDHLRMQTEFDEIRDSLKMMKNILKTSVKPKETFTVVETTKFLENKPSSFNKLKLEDVGKN